MLRPFKDGMLTQACPMSDIMADLASQLEELKSYKEQDAEFESAPA